MMRKVTLIDILNPTKLRDWLNKLASTGGAKGVGIKSITSSQEGGVVTVTTTMTDDTTQIFTFTTGGESA